jgi:hypothetical protein
MGLYDLNTAKQKVSDYSTQKWGRGPQNDTEWGAVGKGINYQDGVDDNELNTAYGNADSYATSLGASPKPSPQPTGAVPPAAPSNPLGQQTQGALQMLLTRGQQAPSLDDPVLKPQMEAFNVQRQRAAERQRASAAERLAANGMASGGSGGALDTALGQIEAGRGLDEANFGAQLVGQEQDARRNELIKALSIAAQMGDNEAARELQRMGLELNRTLGTGDLDLRGRALTQQGQLGRGALGVDLLRALMQNDQFYSGLGLNAAQMQALFNQNAITQLFGGF